MKTIKLCILIGCVLFFAAGCDQDFVEVNTNPTAVTSTDPALLFARTQIAIPGAFDAEHTIVQHFVIPYNTGANLGFNFNADIDGVSAYLWNDAYTNLIRNTMHAVSLLGENTERVNLRSMIRIWKAWVFMGVVDSYGDVPYSEAGKALGDLILFPKYDDDAAIYDDLYNEIKSALAALNPNGDFVSADLFYGTHGSNKTSNAIDQVAKWKKLGNSLLLRLGMRYSKVNPAKAQSIVAEAFAGGVMTSNADNAYVKPDGSLYVYNSNNFLRDNSYFYYAAEPFVNQLKSTSDPRGKFILANFANPAQVAQDANPDTNLANQFGVPVGVVSTDLAKADGPYRGAKGGGLNYSQFNIWTIASPAAPILYVTYAQTSLLLAEAAQRGWVSGSAQTYYENGIRADMQMYTLYPGTTPIPEADITAYLSHPGIDFGQATNNAEALSLINTQYWLVNVRNGAEAFANFRRSGYPALTPNPFQGIAALNGVFPRRLSYPDREASANAQNYSVAAAAMGGDALTARVFWDTP